MLLSTWQIVVLEFLGLITLAVSASASRSIPTTTAGPHFHSWGDLDIGGEKRSGGGDMSVEPGWVWLQREAGEEPQADEEAALELLRRELGARSRATNHSQRRAQADRVS